MSIVKAFAFPFINRLVNGAISLFCFPKENIVQAVKTIDNGVWIDESGLGNDLEFVDANSTELNGVDNIIQLEDNITPFGSDWEIETMFSVDDYTDRGGIVSYVSGVRKFLLGNGGSNAVYLQYYTDNGQSISQGLLTGSDYEVHKYKISWNATTKYLTAYVDNALIGSWTNALWDTIAGVQETFIGRREATLFQKMTICYFKSDLLLVPFVADTATVYDVNSDTPYSILGTAPLNVLQSKYFYILENGGTWDGSKWIPASQLNAGLDVLGNTLTHPSKIDENGFNGGALVQQKNLALYPNDSLWYDATGARKKLSSTDITNNSDNINFANIVEYGKDVRQIVGYSVAQDLANRIKIDECMLKLNTKDAGTEWLTDENGEYLTDENGEYIYS